MILGLGDIPRVGYVAGTKSKQGVADIFDPESIHSVHDTVEYLALWVISCVTEGVVQRSEILQHFGLLPY